MRTPFAILAVVLSLLGPARAQEPDSCDVPGYLLFGDNELKQVAATVRDGRPIDIAVVGTGSSTLPGPNGAASAYPKRMEAALQRRLPHIKVNVTTDARPRQTAAEMGRNLEKLLREGKPTLVIWQAGTFDAMSGVDPDDFRIAVEEGIEKLKAGGADVILMNMQYSPRTESMIALGPYADAMRIVTREQDVPLFDRFAIMRHWSDTGAFDLYATSKDSAMAQRVHDCLGRALTSLVIDAAHLGSYESKASQ